MDHLDPLIAAPAQPVVEQQGPGAEQPAPTAEQQQLADGVFTRQQAQLAGAVLGIGTGLGIVQHLVAETFGARPQEGPKPATAARRRDEEMPR